MALIDFLFKGKNDRLYNDMEAVNNYADMQKAEALKSKLKPVLVPLQMDATGGLDAEATGNVQNYINSPEARQKVLDDKLTQMASQKASPWQKVWGRDLSADVRTFDPETNAMTMETKSLHQPGYLEKAGQGLKRGLNDLLGGYGENRTQGFSTDNWNNNYLDNGNKKGLAYKLGEGLGSFAKLAESPLGRSLLVGGIVGASGGSGLEALSYGAQTGMLNQANRMKDQMYRNELKKMGFDTSGIRGYIGDDTFNKIFQSKQLQDNAEYRNALLEINKRNQEADNQLAQQKLARQEKQDQLDNYYKGQQIAQGWEKLKQDAKGAEGNNKGDLIFNQLELLEKAFANMPQSKAIVGSKGKAVLTGVTNKIGLRNDDVTAYEAIRNPLVTTLARTIAGEKGVLTDKDFARAEKMVPTSFDSAEQAEAKFKEIKKLVGVSLGGLPVETSSQPSLNVNRNALEEEMKRRGLK